jgi:peptidoglycan/xylan/chitin deacetylase (PgdA/CDA1 family)
MTAPVPVLMYHSVTETPPSSTRRLSVHPDAFARQLDLLRAHGCTTSTFGEFAAAVETGRPLPERSVVLTFDDGYADFHDTVMPLLDARGFTATVFLTTGWLADAGDRAAGRPLDRMLSWAQVRELARAGIEIGAHSHSHAQLDQIHRTALREELRDSKALLESETGVPVRSMAYPFGYSSARVRSEVLAAGYRYAAAVANTVSGTGADLLALPRLTVRRSTDPSTFERIARAEDLGRAYAVDRALTRGWAVVRRSRHAVNRLRGRA